MLTKKCQQTISLLLESGDSGVSVTIARNATPISYFTKNTEIEDSWKKSICDSIGRILKSRKKYMVEISVVKNSIVNNFKDTISASYIIDYFWYEIFNCDGLRITITQKKDLPLSWIIVKA